MRTLILLFLAFPYNLYGQVINDSISNALELKLNQPVKSSTVDCTIESGCLNYALTKSCIKYHNDQWFTFNSKNHTSLFLNISNQDCRDLLGVQAVVLKGPPCEPDKYELISCVSLGTNDNFYIHLDQLAQNTEYLLNIDGYLHDFCDFNLELDTVPSGMPNAINAEIESTVRQNSSLVYISWQIEDEQVDRFEIWRRNVEKYRHKLIATVSLERNAYGNIEKSYEYIDTLDDNSIYNYRLLAVKSDSSKLFFNEFQARGAPPINLIQDVKFKLNYPRNTSLTITIKDEDSDRVLRKVSFHFDPAKHNELQYPTSYLIEEGIEKVRVIIQNNETGKSTSRIYRIQ